VLVGSPVYTDPDLPDVPQVSRNLTDLAAVFTDPALGGFPPEHCVVAGPDVSVEGVGDLLEQAATQAEDLLLFYFAGHGLIGPRRELYLCLRSTRYRHPAYSALRFEAVRDTFQDHGARAANRVLILDSCFSGRALGPTLGPDADTLADELEINGTYTLTSAPPNSVALVRDGEAHTAFTGRLISLLRDGDEHAGDLLTLGEIYRRLYLQLRREGLPLPQQRGTATADLLGLVRNRRPAPLKPAELTEELRALLDSRSPRVRLAGVAELGEWLHDADPRRVLAARQALERVADHDNPQVAPAARQLLGAAVSPEMAARARAALAEAERIANTITDAYQRTLALAEIAQRLTVTDPNRANTLFNQAEHTATTITDRYLQAEVLAIIARRLSATNPNRANTLFNQAEHTATTITDKSVRQEAMTEIARQIAITDLNRAEHIATTITDTYMKAGAMAKIAQQLAITDLNRAEHIATTITDEHWKAQALAQIARQLATTDPNRANTLFNQAEHTATTITNERWKARALAEIARQIAITDPDRAEHIATTITDEHWKALVLAQIAQQLATADPNRANSLFNQAEHIATAITDDFRKTFALAQIAERLATTDPDRAERIVTTITDQSWKALALARMAGRWLRED
jgi:Caspase domain